jgi:hypothetical protein
VMPESGEGGGAPRINPDSSDPVEWFIRVDKLIKEAGLANSITEAGRKIKERAVSINGQVSQDLTVALSGEEPLTVRVGRRIKKITLSLP